MRPSSSLRARLVATTLLASTITAVALVLGLQVLLARSNDGAVHSRLQARAAAADATVERQGNGVEVLGKATTLDQNIWVFDTSGRLIDGRLPAGSLGEAVRRAGRQPGGLDGPPPATGYRLLSRAVDRKGTEVAVIVASQDLAPYESAETHSLWLSILLGLVTVLLASGAAWIAATRSLQQVALMAERADDWREHDLRQRFQPGPGGDELTRLGRTLDGMLDRISEALLAERRLTDEIAHELRTPLSVIRAEADLARAATADPAVTEALAGIVAAADRMRASIDTMLTLARAHADTDARCTVGELLDAIGAGGSAPDVADAVLLAAPLSPLVAALRPLLDNARFHGAGEPAVRVVAGERHAVIGVYDDGPGIAQPDLERVFSPGHTTRAGGSGLGLPLARRMARAVGAEVVAKPGPGGRFELRVPRA